MIVGLCIWPRGPGARPSLRAAPLLRGQELAGSVAAARADWGTTVSRLCLLLHRRGAAGRGGAHVIVQVAQGSNAGPRACMAPLCGTTGTGLKLAPLPAPQCHARRARAGAGPHLKLPRHPYTHTQAPHSHTHTPAHTESTHTSALHTCCWRAGGQLGRASRVGAA